VSVTTEAASPFPTAGGFVGLTPQLLGEYEAVMPGAADKLLNAAMEEVKHRRELEKR